MTRVVLHGTLTAWRLFFFLIFLFLFFFCRISASGDLEDGKSFDVNKAVFDGIQKILEKLEDQERRLGLLEEQLAEQRDCARKNELESFQNMSELEFHEMKLILERCSTKDQISELREVLQTDECKEGIHLCSEFAFCRDKLVTYECHCRPGYHGDGFTCDDVNECRDGNYTCGANEFCANRFGSYECLCERGFERRGDACIDVTCISPSFYLEGLGCVTPIFTRMTWEESRRTCEAIGQRLLENVKMDHLVSLGEHFGPLMEHSPHPWIGLKDLRWLTSGEEVTGDVWAEASPDGGCGCLDLRGTKLGIWDGGCNYEDFAFCQTIWT